jgi:hypothetical protein
MNKTFGIVFLGALVAMAIKPTVMSLINRTSAAA